MKALQTIPRLTARSSGPATCTFGLVKTMNQLGNDVKLVTLSDGSIYPLEDEESSEWLIKLQDDSKPPLYYSHNISTVLKTANSDLYHCNGLWMGVNHETCLTARKKGKKYIISTHGMLYPNALKIHYWKKWLLLKLWFNKDIASATCLHATCNQEAEYCRRFGYKGPIAVIPNPVVIPPFAKLALAKPQGRKQIGFLGRLHPIKKVESVLYAISLLSPEERSGISFQIMGKYDDSYESFLKGETTRLDLEDCVSFVGFVTGEEKYKRLQQLWALFVPSESENFGMIVPEALICGTPVFASLGTPWDNLSKNHCGWWADNSPETIAKTIREVIEMSEEEVLTMGRNGRRYIEENYRDDIVGKMMADLYSWLINGGSKPVFVHTEDRIG